MKCRRLCLGPIACTAVDFNMNATPTPLRAGVDDDLEGAGRLAVPSDQPAHVRGVCFDSKEGRFLSIDPLDLDHIGVVDQRADDGKKQLVDVRLVCPQQWRDSSHGAKSGKKFAHFVAYTQIALHTNLHAGLGQEWPVPWLSV